MPEITTEVQDTNSKINQRMQEEEVTADNIHSKATEVAIKESGLEEIFKPQSEWEKGQKEAGTVQTTKKTRTRVAKTVTTGKVSSVADSIAKMEEKITLLKYVDSIKVPEVPVGLTKDGRETLLQIGKDVEALKCRMIAAIQKS